MAEFLCVRYGRVTRSVDAGSKAEAILILRPLAGERVVSKASHELDMEMASLPKAVAPCRQGPTERWDKRNREQRNEWQRTYRAKRSAERIEAERKANAEAAKRYRSRRSA